MLDAGASAYRVGSAGGAWAARLREPDWLAADDVKTVVMEATGVYWKPIWAVLEDRFELMLVKGRVGGRRLGRAAA